MHWQDKSLVKGNPQKCQLKQLSVIECQVGVKIILWIQCYPSCTILSLVMFNNSRLLFRANIKSNGCVIVICSHLPRSYCLKLIAFAFCELLCTPLAWNLKKCNKFVQKVFLRCTYCENAKRSLIALIFSSKIVAVFNAQQALTKLLNGECKPTDGIIMAADKEFKKVCWD